MTEPDLAAADVDPVNTARGFQPGDAVAVLVLVATGLYWFLLTDRSWFFFDDWALSARGRTIGDFLQPYNGHLSVPYILVYRVHMGVFGYDAYASLRIVGFACLLAVPALVHLTSRGRWGPGPACVAAVLLVWTRGLTLEPGGMNHNMSIAAGVIVAAALPREGRGAELAVALALAFSLSASGGGVVIAVAAGVHCLLVRPPRSRWAAVLVPSALWAVWWVTHRGAMPELADEYALPLGEQLLWPVHAQLPTFRGAAAGSTGAGIVLMVLVVVWLGRRLREDPRRTVPWVVPWLVANLAWWWGLANSRGAAATPETPRYRFVASVLIILAMVPWERAWAPRPAAAREASRRFGDRAWAVGAVALAAALVAANRGPIVENAQLLADFGDSAHRLYAVLVGVPESMADDEQLTIGMGGLSVGELRSLSAGYGPHWPHTGAEVDRRLIAHGAVALAPLPADVDRSCEASGVGAEVVTGGTLVLLAGDAPVVIRARRFGQEPGTVGELAAGAAVEVRVTLDVTDDPLWSITADGACVAG